MLLRLFNKKSVISVVLIPVVAALFWMQQFMNPQIVEVPAGESMMPLYSYFSGLLQGAGTGLGFSIAGFVLIILNALIISLLSYEFQFFQQRSFLPGIVYLSIISSFPPMQTFHPVYPATLLVLLSIYYIFSTYHRKEEISSTFNASFLLSLASLFYFQVVVLLPLIWISIFVLQKSDNWRLLVIPLIGIALPWLFLWAYLFISDSGYSMYSAIISGLGFVNNRYLYNILFLISTGLVFLLSLLGSISLLNSVSIRRMSTRKYFIILYWMIGLTVPSVFLFQSTGIMMIAISTIPVSYLISHFFLTGKKRFWKEFLFLILILILVSNYLFFIEKA